MIPRSTSHDVYYFRVGPWHFAVGNYEDWKPGYQIHLDDHRGFVNCHRTFRTPQNAEKWVRSTCRRLAKQLLKELS